MQLTQQQSEHYEMFIQVKRTLSNNAAKWSSIPALQRYETQLSTNVQTIREILDDGTEDTKPTTANKQETKQDISIKTGILAGSMLSHGAENGIRELEAMSDYAGYKLNRVKDSDFPSTVRSVTQLARKHLEALADQGVTQAEIEGIEAATKDFENLMGGARTISTENVGNKAALQQTIDETNELLRNNLDNSMKRFQLQDPIFYQQYEMARTIVDK